MTDSFWEGGPEAYEKGLKEHYAALRAEISSRMEQATDAERMELESEIKRLEAELQSKLDDTDDYLF